MFEPGTPNDGEDLGVNDDPLDRLLAAYEKAEPFEELRGLDAESAEDEPSLDEPAGDAAEERPGQQDLSELFERDRIEREQHKTDVRRERRRARARQKAERKERRRVEREEREAAELERARIRAAEEEDRRRARELSAVEEREEKRIAKERRERLREEQRRERQEERARTAAERAERRRLLARAREEERREREHRAFRLAERERMEREAGQAAEPAEAAQPAVPEVVQEPAAPPEPPAPPPRVEPQPTPPPPPAPAPPAPAVATPAATPPASSAPRLAFERVRPLPEGWTPSPKGGPQYARAPRRGTYGTQEPTSRFGSHGRLRRPPTRRAVVAVAALVTVAALSGGGGWYAAQRDRVDHPDAWDARAVGLVSFVEAERGRAFAHPVAIDLVAPTTFDDRWSAERHTPTDLVGNERDAAFLRSLGLTNAQGVLSLGAAPPLATARRAFYSPAEQRITMTGELDVVGRSALVAALTMALYDQAFGLPDHADDPAERLALAVAYGGAEITRDSFLDTLPPGDRASAEAAAAMAFASTAGPLTQLERLRAATARWAHPAVARWGAPHDGDALVDDAPTSEEHLLAPNTYLLAEDPVAVEQPALERGERRLASGELGALHWLVLLAGRVDAMTALDAADGWAGDRWTAFDVAGRTCTRVAWIGDTERDATEMRAALERWAAAVPGGDGRVTVDGDTLVLTSCDPGADALLDTANVEAAIATAVARTAAYTQIAALLESSDAEHAWCLTDTALHELGSTPRPPVEFALAASLDEPGRRLVVESTCV